MLRWTVLAGLTLAAPVAADVIVFDPADLPGGARITEANALASAGDPKAIKPAVETLKDDKSVSSGRDRQVKDAARTVGLFGYTPAGDDLVRLLSNESLGPTARDEILIALARLNDKKLAPLLQKQLNSYRSIAARSHAARALVEMDEHAAEARTFLLAELENHLAELDDERQFLGGVREVLATTADQELADAVAALAERQTSDEVKSTLAKLAGAMRTNLKPLGELVAIAEDNTLAKKDDRYAALAALAERGTPAEIPTLLALKPWDLAEPDADVQRYVLRQQIATAVGRIQARHWQQLQSSNTPLVTNVLRRLEEQHGDPPLQNRPGSRVPRVIVR